MIRCGGPLTKDLQEIPTFFRWRDDLSVIALELKSHMSEEILGKSDIVMFDMIDQI